MHQSDEVIERLDRHTQFWGERYEGEGAYFAVTAPSNTQIVTEKKSELTVKERWLNVEYRLEKHKNILKNTYFAGDAIPTVFTDFGPGVLAAYLGVESRFAEDTVWFDNNPIIHDWNDFNHLKLDTEGEMFQAMRKLTKSLCEDSRGEYIVSIPDIGVNLDVLASLRGTEALLRDMIGKTGTVQSALERIDFFWSKVFRECVGTILSYLPAVSTWIPLAGRKSWYPLMSEFSTMISPKMFERVSMPALQREAENLDYVLFNLDGESQIKYLPMILELEGLHSIEWDPVPKLHKMSNYFQKDFTSQDSLEVYQKIQAAGKKIVINGIKPDQVKPIFDIISPDGVFLFVKCENVKEADEFMECSAEWRK